MDKDDEHDYQSRNISLLRNFAERYRYNSKLLSVLSFCGPLHDLS